MFDKLAAPFPVDRIHWRVGATNSEKTQGIALAYIDARDVMERLDEVCGPENWQCEYPFPGCCEISIKVGSDDQWHWVKKSNGAGETDFEGAKGMFSDAFKRAAVLWGVGRYLYALPNEWVPIVQRGRSYVIQPGKEPNLPAWANPLGDVKSPEVKQEHIDRFKSILEEGDHLTLYCFSKWMGPDKFSTLYNSFPQGQKVAMKRKVDDMCAEGAAVFNQYVSQYREQSGDELWVSQTSDEVGEGIFKMIAEAA